MDAPKPVSNAHDAQAGTTRSTPLVVLCTAFALVLTGGIAGQESRPAFRVAVHLIPVDVQVVDKAGQPVRGLTADRFEVTINGRRRKVVSADLVDYRTPGEAADAGAAVGSPPSSATPDGDRLPGRIFVLAIDANSFDESRARPVIRTAADFIRQLAPDDEVGLFTYPGGPTVDPTTDHDAIIRSLDKVVARHDVPRFGEFSISPADLIELSSLQQTDYTNRLALQFCPPGDDPLDTTDQVGCLQRLDHEVQGQVVVYEGAAQIAAGSLRSLMAGLGRSPQRKTLVLLSGGLLSSDEPGKRPDNRYMGLDIGRAAAQSNVNVYAVFVDAGRSSVLSASARGAPSTFRPGLESQLQSRWLEDFAGSAGGSLLRVAAGDGQPAFAQVLRESSAFYLLGVEPGSEDRDGRVHEMRVKVRDSSASVRGRSWVFVPKTGTAPPDLVGTTPASARPTRPAEPPASPLPPPPPAVAALAAAFDRDDLPSITAALAHRDANSLIQAFRTSASPWPTAPRRTAIFALDLAAEGLRTSSPFTRREALRLMAEYMVRVRLPEPGRDFECHWLWTAAAVLQGQSEPEISTVLVDRAAERCPDDPNIRLARAVVRDQELMAIAGGPDVATRQSSVVSEPEARVLRLYELAAENASVRVEVAIRSAYLHFRGGRAIEGLALLDKARPTSGDQQIVYLHYLVRGQILAVLGRLDEAAAAFRAAATEFPTAPSAMVGLMTTAVGLGHQAEAAALAGQVLVADPAFGDPWWFFPLGDYRAYATIRAELRSLAE